MYRLFLADCRLSDRLSPARQRTVARPAADCRQPDNTKPREAGTSARVCRQAAPLEKTNLLLVVSSLPCQCPELEVPSVPYSPEDGTTPAPAVNGHSGTGAAPHCRRSTRDGLLFLLRLFLYL